MARQTEQKPAKSPNQSKATSRKIAKLYSHNHHLEFIPQGIKQREQVVTESSRKKGNVSATALFGKKIAKKSASQRFHQQREASPENKLISEIRNGFHDVQTSIESSTKESLDKIFSTFETRLNHPSVVNSSLLNYVSKGYDDLRMPLAEDMIQTTFKYPSGKETIKTVDIGGRVAAFKGLLEMESVKLEDYWKQWDEVQRELRDLGRTVLGEEVFTTGRSKPAPFEESFKHTMDLIDADHETKMREILDEVDELDRKISDKLTASERKLTREAKSEQAKLILAVMEQAGLE